MRFVRGWRRSPSRAVLSGGGKIARTGAARYGARGAGGMNEDRPPGTAACDAHSVFVETAWSAGHVPLRAGAGWVVTALITHAPKGGGRVRSGSGCVRTRMLVPRIDRPAGKSSLNAGLPRLGEGLPESPPELLEGPGDADGAETRPNGKSLRGSQQRRLTAIAKKAGVEPWPDAEDLTRPCAWNRARSSSDRGGGRMPYESSPGVRRDTR